VRVVVADEHPTSLRALRAVIAADPRLEVVAAVADLRAARSAVVRHRAAVLVVDTGVIDANGGVLGPLPAGTSVVVVGMEDSPGVSERARRQGADGYVVKDSAHLELIDALLRGHAR
jgi:DNA-binding NarL/FixJ family response regulator